MTRTDSPEVQPLLDKRSGMAHRLLQLRDVGLPTQFALAMFRYAIAGDAILLARTCGIPPRAQRDLDLITTRTTCALLHADDMTETTHQCIFIPTRLGGLGMSARAAFTASWIATLGKLRQWTQQTTHQLGEQLQGLGVGEYSIKITPILPMRTTSTLKHCTPWHSKSINANYPRRAWRVPTNRYFNLWQAPAGPQPSFVVWRSRSRGFYTSTQNSTRGDGR